MTTQNAALARRGYEALMSGELEALKKLMAPDLSWRGWEPGPRDCHSRDEALAVIRERLSQNAIGDLREVTDLGAGRVLVVTGFRPDSEISATDLGLPEGHDSTAHVVTIRDGQIVAMQDYRSRDDAVEAEAGGRDGG